MRHFWKFSLFLTFGFFLAGCEDVDPLPEIPDDPDATFTYNPNLLDWELAERCALYSALAYQETRIMKNSSFPNKPNKAEFNNLLSQYTSKNIQYFYSPNGKDNFVENKTPVVLHEHLKSEGYNPNKIISKNYGNNIEHDISYTLAYKEVNGGEILLVVILRGTDGVEWRGNMDVWRESFTPIPRHFSFEQANKGMQNAINDYIRDNNLINKSINLLITGHSRGAAVANLLAVDENSQKWCNGNVKNVYAYTFATPNNTTEFKAEHSNIYNFCFNDDFVPQVPLKKWGYGKNGKTYIARAGSLNKDLINRYIQLSEDGRNSVFNYSAVERVLQAFLQIAPTVGKYYNTEPLLDMKGLDNPRYISMYTYMRNYLAQAAVDVAIGTNNPFGVGSAGLALYNQSRDEQSDVYEIADFFLDGMGIASYVNDTHQALTYYYALISGKDKFNEAVDDEDEWVLINGVKWATRNVDKPGTFAVKPENAGMLYQWNRKVGWSSTDPLINSDGGTTWNSSNPTGTVWEKSNDPSPAGWRVPTSAESNTLLAADKVNNEWAIVNGVTGRKFTDKTSGNSIFLPAGSFRSGPCSGNVAGILSTESLFGHYWCSTRDGSNTAYALRFDNGGASEGGIYLGRNYCRDNGLFVRSVVE